MRKWMVILAVLVTLSAMAIPMVIRGAQGGQAGDSNIVQVNLRPPEEPWGTMHYNLEGCTCDFVFNAHSLEVEPAAECTLKFGNLALGTGLVNEGCNVHIAGSVSIGSRNTKIHLYCGEASTRVLRTAEKYTFSYLGAKLCP